MGMIEGFVLLPSLSRPSFVIYSWFALALPAMKRIAGGVARSGILFPVTTMDEHHGGLCDSDCKLLEAIDASTAYADSDGIRFRVMARSIFVGVLPNTCLDGQNRWGTCPRMLGTWRLANRG